MGERKHAQRVEGGARLNYEEVFRESDMIILFVGCEMRDISISNDTHANGTTLKMKKESGFWPDSFICMVRPTR